MTSLTTTPLSSSSLTSLRTPSSRLSSSLPALKPLRDGPSKRRIKSGKCRADLSQEGPFVAAIGACMLSSLVLPAAPAAEEDGDTVMSSADVRFAVMGIIGFIPYFNWLGWVFSWLETGKRRYIVYALVYLAPYIRSNMSLSPEESWLPLASIIFCIVHIQLEASIRNGDIQGFRLFSEASKRSPSISQKKASHLTGHQELSEEGERGHMNLPSSERKSRNEIQEWDVPRKPLQDHESLTEDWDDDHRRKR